jgi:citrate lyase subunit beta / citryl-CoA lyase
MQMRTTRSFLFIPASRPKWIDKAASYGADAVILDLEDSVPIASKAEARENAARSIGHLTAQGQRVFVRINRTPHMYDFADILSIMHPALEGILVPKPNGVADIELASALIGEAESRAGVNPGAVALVPVLETARSIIQAAVIAEHPRVTGVIAASAKNGDVARSMGFQWTKGGLESLYLRSSVIAATRAAGKHPIGGLWQDVHDIAGLEVWAKANRQLGFAGELVLHPSNVAAVNAAYTPSESDVAYYKGMIEAFETAQAEGRAAIIYEGDHIDYAHVSTAREVVALAQSLHAG